MDTINTQLKKQGAKAGRHCKTCRHLIRLERGTVFRCGWNTTFSAPWPIMEKTYAPDLVISPRHVVPGNNYPLDDKGSTSDWTEVMDCPTYAFDALGEVADGQDDPDLF